MGALLRCLDIFPRAGLGLFEATGEQTERPHNDRQHVVEVVRDAAGELSDGFHFLRMAQLVFDLLTFGDLPVQFLIRVLELLRARQNQPLKFARRVGLEMEMSADLVLSRARPQGNPQRTDKCDPLNRAFQKRDVWKHRRDTLAPRANIGIVIFVAQYDDRQIRPRRLMLNPRGQRLMARAD